MPARSVVVQGPGKCCGRTVCTFPWIYPSNECLDCSYPPHHSGTSVLRSLCSSLESRLPVGAAGNGICQTRTSLKWEKEEESTPFTPVSNFSTVTFCVFLSTCICDLTSHLFEVNTTFILVPLPLSHVVELFPLLLLLSSESLPISLPLLLSHFLIFKYQPKSCAL